MKEAAGEANMTVITIILIGIVLAVATPIVSSLMSNASKRSECYNNGQCWNGTACGDCDDEFTDGGN